MLVGPEDTPYVRQSELTEYVSRAGHKLAGALDAFPDIEVEGKRCLTRELHRRLYRRATSSRSCPRSRR